MYEWLQEFGVQRSHSKFTIHTGRSGVLDKESKVGGSCCEYCVACRDLSGVTASSKAKGLCMQVWSDGGVNRSASSARSLLKSD